MTVNVVLGIKYEKRCANGLGGVQYQDTYDGNFTTRRAVVYTLSFTAKTYLYGPAQTQKTIKKFSQIYIQIQIQQIKHEKKES